MELPKQVGYILVTDDGRIMCKEEGRLFLAAFPLCADITAPFLLCKYKSGAKEYAREWHEQVFFDMVPARVKPMKVVVEMRPFMREAKHGND